MSGVHLYEHRYSESGLRIREGLNINFLSFKLVFGLFSLYAHVSFFHLCCSDPLNAK